jgi:hypothetical protein
MVFTRENSGVPCFETTPFFLETLIQGFWLYKVRGKIGSCSCPQRRI